MSIVKQVLSELFIYTITKSADWHLKINYHQDKTNCHNELEVFVNSYLVEEIFKYD